MRIRWMLTACLVFSGLSALVYQVLWTRLLGFAFSTTTEAIGTVLAVFFGGMALGNLLAARRLHRVERPLRLYGLLELGIGAFALLSLPLLQRLDLLYGIVGADHSPGRMMAIRAGVAGLLLLPPTMAMGATLPVVARGLVAHDESLGRWSAYLYSANTFGAVVGAYLCGFWMIPWLGLTRTVIVAALVNLAVAGLVWLCAGHVRSGQPASPDEAVGDPMPPPAARPGERRWFLLFFAVSGFVAIGYEIVWSKVFTIVMEGTLYGFSTVLSAYLLGLALGSLLIAGVVDRIRDLPRAFGLLHAGIALSVAVGLVMVADLPYWHRRIAQVLDGGGGIHGLFLLAAPIVLIPTILFGAAFPVLIRLLTTRARAVGEGMGVATAVNTGGSIAASLLIGFWVIPSVGIDATAYALVLLELFVALLVLMRFQTSHGVGRLIATASTGLLLLGISLSYNGVHLEQAVMGRWIDVPDLGQYRRELGRRVDANRLVIEGRTSIVTVNTQSSGWKLMTNGMPEAGYSYAPPHRSLAALLLGMLPYLVTDSPERALVVGFGGGTTVDALRQTSVEHIEVVELEEGVLEAAMLLYQGRESPLIDPRVELTINDGRNHLLLGRYLAGEGYDIIASQPSHPWLAGAANLFTQEYFELARDNLNPGGAFALWVNGFHAEPQSLLALFTSFERIFPGSVLISSGEGDHRSSFLLLGTREQRPWSLARMASRMAEPRVAQAFALQGIEGLDDLFARFEGPLAGFAAISPDASNTDDNAFVEVRLSRNLSWEQTMDYSELENRLDSRTPVLPPFDDTPDVPAIARAMFEAQKKTTKESYGPKLLRLLRVHGAGIDPLLRAVLEAETELRRPDTSPERRQQARSRLLELGQQATGRAEALRTVALYCAEREKDYARAGRLFAEAWRRSGRDRDAYDAARAWHWVDPDEGWRWVERIAPERRSAFPRIALFDAERALERWRSPGQTVDASLLAEHYRAVLTYRETADGHRLPGVDALLSRLAWALGDEPAARARADADARLRGRLAASPIKRANEALAKGDLADAESALQRARELLPSDAAVLQLEARLADAAGDADRLSSSLWQLRSWAPTLRDGVASENIMRAALRLPLLPQRRPEDLTRADSRADAN